METKKQKVPVRRKKKLLQAETIARKMKEHRRNMTPEERDKVRLQNRSRNKKRRAQETDEERELRNFKSREAMRLRRKLQAKKLVMEKKQKRLAQGERRRTRKTSTKNKSTIIRVKIRKPVKKKESLHHIDELDSSEEKSEETLASSEVGDVPEKKKKPASKKPGVQAGTEGGPVDTSGSSSGDDFY